MSKRIITDEDIEEISSIIYSVIMDILNDNLSPKKPMIQAKLEKVKERVKVKEVV